MKNFWNELKEVFKANSTLLTGFMVAIILFTGFTIVEKPEMWWVSLALTVTLCLIIFLFMNAKVFVKSIVSFIVLSFAISFASLSGFGMYGDYSTTFLWVMTTLAVYFLNLSFSYYFPGGSSRWGINSITTIIGTIATSLLIGFVSFSNWVVLAGGVIQFLTFVFFYRSSRKTRFNKNYVPEVGYSEAEVEKFVENMNTDNLKYVMNSNKSFNSLIVWNDKYAVQFLPALMRNGFVEDKKKGLTYLEKPINPWFLNISFKMMSLWGTKKAPVFNIILDKKNSNGNLAKTVGVSIPDSKKMFPLGIMPARNIHLNAQKLLDKAVKEYKDFLEPLTEKQLNALNKLYDKG